ncbi:MAG: ferredoxin [Erysipelotrichales bacterium]|nr:ferredoxin [Bacilli bacterium]MDD4123817.1 ferredoxin [Bacilli bacterium]MDD4584898.1 ferredoxin [Bacilli bacterium]MEA4820655.1 ferredoxin [Erysipelotrichales bacterium]
MAKKFVVKKDTCIGCGVCAAVASAVFAIGSDGLAETVISEVPEDLVAQAEEAMASCPVQAIVEE